MLSVYLYVDEPGPPTCKMASRSTVAVTCDSPPDADRSKVLKYKVRYRKKGKSQWRSVPETTDHESFINVDENSVYEFKVAVKYEGGEWGDDTGTVALNIGPNDYGKC